MFKLIHHSFEHHKHSVCNENTLHFHKKEIDCDIDTFFLSTFTFSNDTPVLNKKTNFPKLENYSEKNTFYSNLKTSKFLRGPPVLS